MLGLIKKSVYVIYEWPPSKPSSRDHSDEEDAEARLKAATTSNTTFSSVVSSVASSATSTTTFTTSSTSQPKVPPLKIVLSGQNGNSGSSSVMEDKKSPSGKFIMHFCFCLIVWFFSFVLQKGK